MLRDLVERVRGVLLAPRQSLPLTLAETGAPRALLGGYIAPLAALGPLALFVCDGLIGAWHAPVRILNSEAPGGWARAPLPALVEMLLSLAISVAAWACLAAVMAALAPAFGGLRDRPGAAKAAAYTLTPVWIAGVAQLFGAVPYLTWMASLALVAGVAWATFVGIVALPLHLATPKGRAPGHVLASLGVTAVAASLLYLGLSWTVYAVWTSRFS